MADTTGKGFSVAQLSHRWSRRQRPSPFFSRLCSVVAQRTRKDSSATSRMPPSFDNRRAVRALCLAVAILSVSQLPFLSTFLTVLPIIGAKVCSHRAEQAAHDEKRSGRGEREQEGALMWLATDGGDACFSVTFFLFSLSLFGCRYAFGLRKRLENAFPCLSRCGTALVSSDAAEETLRLRPLDDKRFSPSSSLFQPDASFLPHAKKRLDLALAFTCQTHTFPCCVHQKAAPTADTSPVSHPPCDASPTTPPPLPHPFTVAVRHGAVQRPAAGGCRHARAGGLHPVLPASLLPNLPSH